MKETMWRKKQIQTILPATHTVTEKLLKGKMLWIECNFAQTVGKKQNKTVIFEGCIDVGPTVMALPVLSSSLLPPLSYWYCFNSAAHLNAFMSIKVVILTAEVVFGKHAAF